MTTPAGGDQHGPDEVEQPKQPEAEGNNFDEDGEEEVFCDNCGQAVDDDDETCWSCGAKL